MQEVKIEQNFQFVNMSVNFKNDREDGYSLNFTVNLLKDCEGMKVSLECAT